MFLEIVIIPARKCFLRSTVLPVRNCSLSGKHRIDTGILRYFSLICTREPAYTIYGLCVYV